MDYTKEKENFRTVLKAFATSLKEYIVQNDEWTIKEFIDVFKNVYTISTDTKIVSKVLELHIFPLFLDFAAKNNFILELATCQNWYPDLTFISKRNSEIKFAVDLKTTYRSEIYDDFCNCFTLGSHGKYFINRESTKNIQYPYSSYVGHFCLGIIYSRAPIAKNEETKKYSVDEIEQMPSVIKNFTFLLKKNGELQVTRVEAAIPPTLAVFIGSKIF